MDSDRRRLETRRKDLFWHVLLAASTVAALVSLLTTGLGLQRYLSLALAWPLAIAVQAGLFGLAWLLAVGRRRLRGVIVGLYALTMPFSVVFSYVMLQSEFTARVRPLESRRALYDRLRSDAARVNATLDEGLAAAEELELRLGSWLAMERDAGWTLASCEEEEHCYLAGVCDRVRRRLESWERNLGRPYRQGPGEALVFGLLQAEVDEIARVGGALEGYRADWAGGEAVFADGLDNRERLRRHDAALAGYPGRELQSVLCAAAPPPAPPAYEAFARDEADSEERPIYAFEDLAQLVAGEHRLGRGDYPTVFALGLAIFIDLFVLLVAVGAGLLPGADGELHDYPVARLLPPEWGESLRRDITDWVDGALLDPEAGRERRREFVSRLVDALRFDGGGTAVLMPRDAEQSRFGLLMTRARAARPTAGGERPETGLGTGFVLEEWVVPALTRYLRGDRGAAAGLA